MRASSFLLFGGLSIGLVACGDDDGSGGGGGTTQTTSSSASTGTPSTTQASTSTGMSNAPFADCSACVAGACAELQAECNDDPECAAWLACANACEAGDGLAACLDGCDDAAIGLAPSHLIYACGCNA